jgi:hypothetical protein
MVVGASYPRRGTRGGESGWRRSALDPPRGAAALPMGAASFDGDSSPHEGGLAAQGGSSPGTAVAERRRLWRARRRGGQPRSALAVSWPLGAWSSSTEVSSSDNTKDNGGTRLSETGHCIARMLNAAASPGLQGCVNGAMRRAPAV